ncbi:glycosyltransferase family 4 protein [Oryzomonas japonica]|uniref:Glycosyltransferase family 4 protein n=1 Tax=Oryzomonas japonica TaxID=2603858 RepID=A0A7J4ZS84_9BACT|nr:glycosyltransferase family 4 protein [Oryzomonas japonica]KAB0666166.1 glycosyltransferase family 4 protein [Oryzomonas japonica]
MKIVFLAPFGIRPKGTVIARMLPLAAELQGLGHQVVIIAPPYTNPEDSGKTEVLRGVRLVNVALPAGGNARRALPLAWRMFRAALRERADVVHLFKPKGYGGLAAMAHIALHRLGVGLPPLFVDTDDWEGKGGMNELHTYSSLEKRFFAFQEQWLSRHAAGMTVASRELERLTAGLGVAAAKILYLPNCVEQAPPGDGLRARKRLGIEAAAPVVLLYTRFFEFSQERLHRLFADLYRRVPGVRFLVVGKGRHGEEERLAGAAETGGFREALVMAGWVEPQEIPDYLAAADVAIYPLDDTLVNRAKCPAKLTEIIRAGIPVVADRVGQAAEYVSDGASGYLCDPAQVEAMAEKTAALALDRTLGRQVGEEGRRYLAERFTWHEFAGRLAMFYAGNCRQKSDVCCR